MRKPQRSAPKSHFGGGFIQESFARPTAQTKPPKSILIVTEGRNTEPLYLKSLAAHWKLHPHVTHIEPGCEGIPANLVKKALEVQERRADDEENESLPYNQLGSFDETWIVFDTEHAARQKRLQDGLDLAKAHGIRIAHSTPCFEFWLVLHYALKAPSIESCKEACALFEKVSGMKKGSYSKTKGAATDLIDKLICLIPTAVRNTDQLTNQQAGDPFPANPSTAVQALVRSLHDTLPGPLRDRFPLPPLCPPPIPARPQGIAGEYRME